MAEKIIKKTSIQPVIPLKDEIQIHVDIFEGLTFKGWAWNKNQPKKRLMLEILDGNTVIGLGKADIFREDLLAEKMGDGKYAFRISASQSICDGETHQLTVREQVSGYIPYGFPVQFSQEGIIQGSVDTIEGTAVAGWASDASNLDAYLNIELYEHDQLIATATANIERENNLHGFRLVLPNDCLDGRPHLFVVKQADTGYIIGSLATITPYMQTPWNALQLYGGSSLPGCSAPMASLRYESLRQELAKMTETSINAPDDVSISLRIQQLFHTHEQLIRGFEKKQRSFGALSFPEIKSPKVSIVIPIHNKFAVTYNCLCSLLFASNKASFEVIIVDDGSSDESVNIPELIKGVHYLRNETAQGFILSCNRGGKSASGDYIVMLNNDTEVTVGWLDELILVFETFDNVGLAGSKLLYPDGRLQEAGGIVWNTGDPWNYGRNANAHDPRYNYTRQVDFLSGASIMLPTILWNELQGFDEAFVPAYFEDTDLAFRVRAKGYKVVYTPFSQVIHFEGQSNGTCTSSSIKKYQEINRPKFKARWSNACRHNGAVGVDVELNKDRNVHLRALVIDTQFPRPDIDAGSYAAIQEMQLLQALGFKLTFAPENMAYLGHYTETLQRMGIETLYAPFIESVHEVIQKRGTEFDVIYITRYYVAQKYLEAIRRFAPNAKIVFCNADLHFLRELREAMAKQNKDLIERAIETRDEELAVMRDTDVTLSYNDVEHAVITSHNLDSTKVARCPWVVKVKKDVPSFAEREGIAFLGGFDHRPNAEAVEFFINSVMPLLRKKLPKVPFLIYGSNIPEKLLKLEDEDIIVKGWVADVGEVYDTCRIFVAPLITGAGIKGKVIGALAHGVPTIISKVAAEGTGLSNGNDVLIAEKPEEWVSKLVMLYNEEKEWKRISEQAQKYTRENFSFEQGKKLMRAALEMVDIYTPEDSKTLSLHNQ